MPLWRRLRFSPYRYQAAYRTQLRLRDQIRVIVHEERSAPDRPVDEERRKNERDRENVIAPRMQPLSPMQRRSSFLGTTSHVENLKCVRKDSAESNIIAALWDNKFRETAAL